MTPDNRKIRNEIGETFLAFLVLAVMTSPFWIMLIY